MPLPLSALLAVLALAAAAAGDYLITLLTPLGLIGLAAVGGVLALGVLGMAAADLLTPRTQTWQSGLALALVVFTVLTVLFVPLRWVGRQVDFALGASQRQQIVRMVEEGALGSDVTLGEVALPEEYRSASADGVIGIVRSGSDVIVVFLRRLTSVDAWQGLAHTASGRPPQDDPWRGGRLLEIDPLGDGWYWVAAS